MGINGFTVNSLPNAAFVISPSGEIVDINTSFSNLLGYEINELVGKSVKHIVCESEIFRIKTLLKSFNADRMPMTKMVFFSKAERLFSLELNISKLHLPSFSQEGLLVLANSNANDDVNENKYSQTIMSESEEKIKLQYENFAALNNELKEANKLIANMSADLLIANKKAEEHEKLKSAFLANMSHEVRTPINGIVGFSQLLLKEDQSVEERREFIEIIQNCSQQLLDIINDIIDISKIDTNQISLKISQVNLNHLMRDMFHFFHPKAESGNLDLEVSFGLPADNLQVELDDARLRQVLMHVIGNAIKFTPKGKVNFGYTVRAGYLEFFVEDTGVGIPQDMIRSVFDRFIQVETGLSRQAGGTGLGLSIAEALINKMGGEIWAQSVVDVGSTFYFTIPLVRSGLSPIELDLATSNPKDTPRSVNIIIADDNEINYMYLKELLKELNPILTWATNGQEVLDIVKNNENIDLVLMDIKMPLMDGYEATREVKKLRPNLPVIAQTAYAMAGDRDKALEAGCDEYITKPINKEHFQNMIARFL